MDGRVEVSFPAPSHDARASQRQEGARRDVRAQGCASSRRPAWRKMRWAVEPTGRWRDRHARRHGFGYFCRNKSCPLAREASGKRHGCRASACLEASIPLTLPSADALGFPLPQAGEGTATIALHFFDIRASRGTPADMDKSFDPKLIESKWYARWEQAGCFKPSGHGDPYCILLPPPNVTGTLHMGHAFQQTIMDALIRYHRMRLAPDGKRYRTLWQGGTDHAGIATQKIVENQLAAQGRTRHDLGREKFVERVWEWKAESGSTITNQMRRLGASMDWSRERFTMDEGLSAAVRRVFVQWYRDGLLYRGNRLVNWDPVLMTAVSDLEVNNEERDGFLWSIRYDVVDPEPGVVVATTRPETMLGDVAVAVHPEDERYAALVGKAVRLPLCEREIPVIADDYVDREFGTGAVKITPAHDFNDWQIGARHKLAPRVILTLDAKVNDNAPEKYRGMDRFAARKAVLADLEAQGLLIETKKHKLQVPISQRSDAVIEPMLTDQWFLDLTSDTRVDGKPGA